jgi:hypothetical protein
MFGLSPTKLVILAAIIAAIIYLPRIIRQIEDMRKSGNADGAEGVDTKSCPICGEFVVPSQAGDCGREKCPYG